MRLIVVAVLLIAGCGTPAGMSGADAKVSMSPHLIVTATGEDLGVFLEEPDCVWNEQADGEACYGADQLTPTVLYADSNCSGDAYAETPSRVQASRLFTGADGRLWRTGKATMTEILKSAFTQDGCKALQAGDAQLVGVLVDTKAMIQAHAHIDLSIDLR